MPRKARIVVPGQAHHVVQRGNRRQQVFFNKEDYRHYLELLKENAAKNKVLVLGYCLMPNHVHLILVPEDFSSMSKVVARIHFLYTYRINARKKWRGYLWQGRYSSFVMGDIYLLRCLRYIELNPVRAHMVAQAQDYAWSSARSHVSGDVDLYLNSCPLLQEIENWGVFLQSHDPEKEMDHFRKSFRNPVLCLDDALKQKLKAQGIDVDALAPKSVGRPLRN